MAEWARDTPWRQGHVLSPDTAKTVGLNELAALDTALTVVISHDCDIAQLPVNEPVVEVIVGRTIEAADGNFTHGKNVRRLHLPFTGKRGKVFAELYATAKAAVQKEQLADHQPRGDLQLAPEEHSILQRWLAARYRRAAFPDEFDRRLDETGTKEQLTKILKPLGLHIPAIFFDVDDGQELLRRGPDDTYALDIYLLHNTTPDPSLAEAAAIDAQKQIEAEFRTKCYTVGKGWQFIELRACTVMSDEAMSYRQSCLFKKWQLDHISLASAPPGPMLNE